MWNCGFCGLQGGLCGSFGAYGGGTYVGLWGLWGSMWDYEACGGVGGPVGGGPMWDYGACGGSMLDYGICGGLEYWAQVWVPQREKDIKLLVSAQCGWGGGGLRTPKERPPEG